MLRMKWKTDNEGRLYAAWTKLDHHSVNHCCLQGVDAWQVPSHIMPANSDCSSVTRRAVWGDWILHLALRVFGQISHGFARGRGYISSVILRSSLSRILTRGA
jgi:hypothetical protein